MRPPSPKGGNGRGPDGRFAAGWKGGPGNPLAKQVAALRKGLLEAVTPDDLRAVVTDLLQQAKAGDVASAKELFQRLLGPPESLDLISRLDELEQLLQDLIQRSKTDEFTSRTTFEIP